MPGTAGINLVYTGERLLYSYYHRWMLSPQRVWPATVMPPFFSGGRGPFEFYDGNADRQIRAMWEFIRLGAGVPASR